MTAKKNDQEPVYTREELFAAAKGAFGVNPEVVAGALAKAGKTEMTRDEAEKAIKNFLEGEV